MVEREITTIQLTKSTVQRLAQMADKGDTYEDVVLALLDFVANSRKSVDRSATMKGSDNSKWEDKDG